MNNSKLEASGDALPGEAKSRPPPILERTFRFAVEIVKLGADLDRLGSVVRILAPQVVRSGTAIGSQVEEAQAAESQADFISKMAIELKEARETHYRLRVLAAAGIVQQSNVAKLAEEADELQRILGKSIVNTQRGRASSATLRSRI